MSMQSRSSLSALAVGSVWIASTLYAPAQMVPEELAASTVEFWSTRYQRFYESQPRDARNSLERPPGNLWGPPDIIVCEPQNMMAISQESAASQAALAPPDRTVTVDVAADPSRLTTGLRPR